MAVSSCISHTKLLTAIGSDKDVFDKRKALKGFTCIRFPMRQQSILLPSTWFTSNKLFLFPSFPSCMESAYSYNGKRSSKRWLLTTQCSKQTEQEESKIIGELKDEVTAEGTTQQKATAARTVVFWVCSAVVFGTILGVKDGTGKASEFFAGYLLEQSLSVDNLFVFILIFKYFKVPLAYQNRVLAYGIAGAIVFRATMILLGAATLQRFEVVNLFLAGILLYSAFKLFTEGDDEEEDLSNNFIVKTCKSFIPVTPMYDEDRFITVADGARKATPLLLTMAVVELSDIAFAVDSIPAVFGVTRDPFTVFSSNMFAILGLRSLYTLISGSISELEYLQPAVGVVLGFIGCKMFADFFGYHTPTEISLAVVATILGTGVMFSLLANSEDES
eukprot:TRINITY_DN140_c0_g1_i3.p1 TRINITY_DN140_c0_g1~~TRINITY_DN140_c0_g1_i3.p1  ORF type:complete len:389 (+),score=72.29 TRINITY_DN140_c0_g1_i3:306-1472(+)